MRSSPALAEAEYLLPTSIRISEKDWALSPICSQKAFARSSGISSSTTDCRAGLEVCELIGNKDYAVFGARFNIRAEAHCLGRELRLPGSLARPKLLGGARFLAFLARTDLSQELPRVDPQI